MLDFMSLSCKWSLLSCDSCLIDCRKYARYNHAPCKEAECLHFTSFWWQVVSVLSVLVSVLYLQRHTLFRCFTVHIFSCAAHAFRRLLSQHFQCCTWSLLPETECRHLSWSLDQPSCLLIASKRCSNSEPAGPGQNACPLSSAVGSSKRVTISFSRYYLVTRPFTGAINCLQSWRRHRSSSSS